VIYRNSDLLVTWSVVGILGLVGLVVATGFLVSRRL
jgi:hypothetical protein